MKAKVCTIVCFFFLSFVLSCQESKKEEATPQPSREKGARRACNNTVLYKWLYPLNGYVYGPDGCKSYLISQGVTKQFKVQLSNTSLYPSNIVLKINRPDSQIFVYSIVSVTGGTVTTVPPAYFGGSITHRWTCNNMPAGANYELTLNVTVSSIVGSAENGLSLVADSPCQATQNSDCDADENLHLVRS